MSSPEPSPPASRWRFLHSGIFWAKVGGLAGVAGVVVALVAFLFPGGSGPGQSPPSSVAAPAGSCVAKVIPGATTVAAKPFFADVELDEAKYLLSRLRGGHPPQIEATGRISGERLNGDRELLMLSTGDTSTVDSYGQPAVARYYFVGSFEQQDGCWTFGKADACYAGCEGLTIIYQFALAPLASLPEVELLSKSDGLSDADLRRLEIELIGEFRAPIG